MGKGEDQKVEEEAPPKSQAEIKAHCEKTFFEVAMEDNEWIREILNRS